MTFEELLQEVKGLGKGLGSIGAKISKAAGGAGIDVSTNTKALPPSSAGQASGAPQGDAAAAGADPSVIPGEEPVDTSPEMVERLPKPEPMEYDKMGSPNKNKLTGHIVRWGSKEYVLDWDSEFEVYKLVDPETLRVKTRVKPESISVVDYRAKKVKESIEEALSSILGGNSVDECIDELLDG